MSIVPNSLSGWTETPTRVPYSLFFDGEIYDLEQEKIFRGPIWRLRRARGRGPPSRGTSG